MYFKNKHGFYMVELLISLTGWILITGIFVPIFIGMKQQSESLHQKLDALHVLYEYIQTVNKEIETENWSIVLDDTRYEIKWKDTEVDGNKEVFITYENALGKTVQLFERVQ